MGRDNTLPQNSERKILWTQQIGAHQGIFQNFHQKTVPCTSKDGIKWQKYGITT